MKWHWQHEVTILKQRESLVFLEASIAHSGGRLDWGRKCGTDVMRNRPVPCFHTCDAVVRGSSRAGGRDNASAQRLHTETSELT